MSIEYRKPIIIDKRIIAPAFDKDRIPMHTFRTLVPKELQLEGEYRAVEVYKIIPKSGGFPIEAAVAGIDHKNQEVCLASLHPPRYCVGRAPIEDILLGGNEVLRYVYQGQKVIKGCRAYDTFEEAALSGIVLI